MGYSVSGNLSQTQNNRTATTDDLGQAIYKGTSTLHGSEGIGRVYTDKATGKTYNYNPGGSSLANDWWLSNYGQQNPNVQANSTELTNYKAYDYLADALNAVNGSNGALKLGSSSGGFFTYDNPDYQAPTPTTTTAQGVRSETDANGITRSYDAQGNLIYSSDPSEASQITNNGTTAGEQTKVSDYTDARLADLENANLAARQNMNSLLQKYTDPNSSYMQPFNLDKQIGQLEATMKELENQQVKSYVDMTEDYKNAKMSMDRANNNYTYQQQDVNRAVNNYDKQNAVLGGLLETQIPIYNMANEQYARAISQGVPESDWEYRKQIQDALMDYQESRLNPTYAKQADALATKLANQGIEQGGNTYGSEWDIYNRAKNDAYQSAYNNAISLGEDAIQGQFNRDMARYQQIAQDYMNTSTQALQAGKNWADALTSAMNPVNEAYANVNSAMGLINDATLNYDRVFQTDIDNKEKATQSYIKQMEARAAMASASASLAQAARQQQQSEIAGLLNSVSPNNNTGTSLGGTTTGSSGAIYNSSGVQNGVMVNGMPTAITSSGTPFKLSYSK